MEADPALAAALLQFYDRIAYDVPAAPALVRCNASSLPFNSPGRLTVLLPLVLTGLMSVGVAVKLPG